jgi:hypothetical protein
MCIDPASLSILSTIAGIVGTGVSGIAAYSASKAEQAQAKNNAIIAQRNAEDARKRGVASAQESEMKNRQMLGKQINILSERSIQVGSGSALDIIGDTAMFGKMDALTIRNNFEREAIAHETQQMNFDAAAQQSGNKAMASIFGTGASLFQTALGGYGQYKAKQGMSF